MDTTLERTKGYYNTFIVKIMYDSKGKLNGYIRHISSYESAYFNAWEDLDSFIMQHLKPSADVANGIFPINNAVDHL
jgi:hypothetical protein